MFDYLIDHAVKNVWCNSQQDTQYIFAPYRITPSRGALNYCKVMMRDIVLPTQKEMYHIFQVGQLPLDVTGIFLRNTNPTVEEWTSLSSCMNAEKIVIDVYTGTGILLPRFETYYMYTQDKNFIFAVRQNAKIPVDYTSEQIYVKLYSNAYFQTLASDQDNDFIYTEGQVIKVTSEILTVQNTFQLYQQKHGLVTPYVNGFLVKELSPLTVKIGDTVEWVYDSSVAKVVTFTVGDLPSFNSTLDGKRKYLLHYASDGVQRIDYFDDIDLFIVDETEGTRRYGVYYHRNAVDACRMVTHRDYSINVAYFTHLTGKLNERSGQFQLDPRQLKIRMHLRNAGYNRALVFENDRLHELYKLPDALVQRALTGLDASVKNWRAEHLEASGYTKLMRSNGVDITRDMVQDAYGYNAVAKLVGDTPKKTSLSSGRQQVTVAYNLQQFSTAYEYDANGLLLGVYHHTDGSLYNSANDATRLVEMISGHGDQEPDVRFGTDGITLPADYSYRVYMSHMVQSDQVGVTVCDEKWSDITDSDHYKVVNHRLVWQNLDYNQFLMVRTDTKFLAYDLHLRPIDGNLRFSLSEMQDRGAGMVHHVMVMPMGELDVYLNGHPLVKDVDYRLVFPEIVITNKRFLGNTPNTVYHWLHIRFTGFCTSDLKLNVEADTGFIEHGVLSNNRRYDIRDDKVQHIVVNGALKHRDDLVFSETHQGISVVNSLNGQPYSLCDIVVPMKTRTNKNTYTLRAKSLEIDKAVADYMTLKLPQPPRDAPSSITERYPLVSPFVSKILYDIVSGHLDSAPFATPLSDNAVIAICQPYEDWLAFDPSQSQAAADHRYLIIHPHNHYNTMRLTLFQYRFLLRVTKLYCNGLVELSPFITIDEL